MGEMVGKSRPKASISAKVFDKNGALIADLGEVAGTGKKSHAEKLRVAKLRKQLRERKVK